MKKTFTVIEYSSFFAVRHNPSGGEHPMGDGVDTLLDEDGKALIPGTPGFIEAWEHVLNADEQGTLEAYFPQHLEDQLRPQLSTGRIQNNLFHAMNNQMTKPRFSLGQTLATPGAIEALQQAGQAPAEFLDRHVRGDWGDVCQEDAALNDEALIDGSRLLSAYKLNNGTKVWVITEAVGDNGRRAATTILLPEEY